MTNQIILTISILISNRPDTVRKCLDSIKPLLEQVPSELILTDTGCGKEVRTIIEEYTDQIIDFEWCRDFSAARNAGLERAKGEWFLYLDDDEWFEDVSPIACFFNSGEYRAYGFGLYAQRNYLDMEGREYADLLVSRMIRLEPDIRFVYRIHESFNRAPGLPKTLDAYVHHYGYVYQNEEEHRAHAMRNIGLLKEELLADPRNMRHVLQLVQEYNSIDDRETSLEISLDSIRAAQTGPVEGEYYLASLYANEINCYIELGRYGEAIQRGEQHLKSRHTDRLVKALIAGRLTTAYMEKREYGKCLERTKNYWEACLEYRKNNENFSEFETPVTNTCFHERRIAMILGNGVRAAIHLGKDDLAWQWFRGIGWECARPYADVQMVRDILDRMLLPGADGQNNYSKMCDILLSHEEWKGFVLQTMMDNCMRGETFRDRIRVAAAYQGLAGEHWFLKLARLTKAAFLQDGESGCIEGMDRVSINEPAGTADHSAEESRKTAQCNEGTADHSAEESRKMVQRNEGTASERTGSYSPEETEQIAAEVWSVMEESMPMMKALDLPGAVSRLGGDNGHVLDRIPFLRWEKGAEWYFSRYAWREASWWLERLADTVEPDNLRMLVWRAGCGISRASGEAAAMDRAGSDSGGEKGADSQKEMMAGLSRLPENADLEEKGCSREADTEIPGTMEGIIQGLEEYAVCRMALCEKIYRDEIIRDMPEILPQEYRGAYAIGNLLEMTEKQQYAQAVNTVREIRELLPGLAAIMKHYLIWLNDRMERQREESRQAAGEFQVLARQIKARVRGLMEAGEYQAALAIIGQLQALLPGDEEIRRLEEEINGKLQGN